MTATEIQDRCEKLIEQAEHKSKDLNVYAEHHTPLWLAIKELAEISKAQQEQLKAILDFLKARLG